MGPGRGHRQIICYNCGGLGHYACDCTNPTRISCWYYNQFDHEAEDCPSLIAKMHEKGVLQSPPTQNIQMMRSELHEEDLNVNMMLKSGMITGDDKGKQPEESMWVCKALIKELEFELECAKETFMEAKKSFTEASTSSSKDQLEPGMDPSMLTTFLETCMKLLCDSKVVKGLHELITKCVGLGEPHVVRKLGKHALHTRRQMRLTAQIGEYEMD